MFKDNLGKSPFCQYTKYGELERRLGKKNKCHGRTVNTGKSFKKGGICNITYQICKKMGRMRTKKNLRRNFWF